MTSSMRLKKKKEWVKGRSSIWGVDMILQRVGSMIKERQLARWISGEGALQAERKASAKARWWSMSAVR